MADKRLAPVYADRVIDARRRRDCDQEREAMRALTIVCRRAGVPTRLLLDDAARRASSAVRS